MIPNSTFRGGLRWERSMYAGGNGNPPRMLGRVATGYDGDLSGADIHIMVGMAVKYVNDGTYAIAAAGDAIAGVVEGILPYYNSTAALMQYGNYLPNQTAYSTNYSRESQLIIIPVAGQMFRISCDEATSATSYSAYRTLIQNNADHIIVAGTAPTAYMLLDVSTAVSGTTATAQWRIEEIPDQDLQDFTANYVEVLVTCNEMQRNSTTGV